jgi:hypothetical protein
MANRPDALRTSATLLRTCGRAVVVRVLQTVSAPPMEVTLTPCVLKASGDTAEMLVAAGALDAAAGLPAELFSTAARVIADDIVWRVVSYAAIGCGQTVVAWRVQLAR